VDRRSAEKPPQIAVASGCGGHPWITVGCASVLTHEPSSRSQICEESPFAPVL